MAGFLEAGDLTTNKDACMTSSVTTVLLAYTQVQSLKNVNFNSSLTTSSLSNSPTTFVHGADRNEIVLHGYTKFHFSIYPIGILY